MSIFIVQISIDASTLIPIEAESREEAEEKALRKAHSPCLCYQCAKEVELGEPSEVIDVYEN